MPVDIKKLLVEPTANNLKEATPIYPVTEEGWNQGKKGYLAVLGKGMGFAGKPGQTLIIPDHQTGAPEKVYVGVESSSDNMWSLASAAESLPEGTYKIKKFDTDEQLPERFKPKDNVPHTAEQLYKVAIGWALARYKYKIKNGALDSDPGSGARLVVPTACRERFNEIKTEIEATWKTRDLINMPANILNTQELGDEVLSLADEFNARARRISGTELEKKFPLVHSVGKASENPPQLTYFSWTGSKANENAPSILLVGKGVTFDNGGVQVKPGASMESMKKDMGGSANALGLARMIMGNDLPVKLNVVIPIAENAISGNAYRPSDIITARDGTTVEIGHTDAEGRLILADALSFGAETYDPSLIIDFATLTGAQRVADGTEVGGVFSNDKQEGRKMEDIGEKWNDDLQLHHLFEKYRPLLQSSNGADICSKGAGGPGATMAAMFLQHFTRAAKRAQWFHFDINGANTSSKPGRPKGGEAMGMRAAYRYIKAELGL